MLEKMALAIYNEAEKQYGYVGKFQAHNNETCLDGDFDLVGFSRAALQALLEPGEAEVLANAAFGYDFGPEPGDFRAMIQAALDGK